MLIRRGLGNNGYLGKVSARSQVEAVFLFGVAGAAKGLQVAEVVGAALGEGDDVIDFEVGLGTAVATLVVVAIEDVLSNRGGDGDAWSFGH